MTVEAELAAAHSSPIALAALTIDRRRRRDGGLTLGAFCIVKARRGGRDAEGAA
jgi:hypothetical protein